MNFLVSANQKQDGNGTCENRCYRRLHPPSPFQAGNFLPKRGARGRSFCLHLSIIRNDQEDFIRMEMLKFLEMRTLWLLACVNP